MPASKSLTKRKGLRPVPRSRTIRRALGMTQEQFSAAYGIPLGTLRDWEQLRAVPDKTARAYLTRIAHFPGALTRDNLRRRMQKLRQQHAS